MREITMERAMQIFELPPDTRPLLDAMLRGHELVENLREARLGLLLDCLEVEE